MSDRPDSPGARLRAERERRGLSAQKAADELHLEAWVIDALEAGDYARIGATVYAKGHLKKYVSLLGLPQAEMLTDFEAKPPVASAGAPLGSSLDTPRYSASIGQALGFAALVAVGVALVVWKPWQQTGTSSPPASALSTHNAPVPAETPAETSPAATVEAAPPPPKVLATRTESAAQPEARNLPTAVKTVATLAKQPPAASPAAAPAAAPAASDVESLPGAGRARLKLSFTSDSWVDVRDALGNRAFAGTGSANTVKTIAGQAPMHVYLRAGSGVQLEINGHVVAIGPQFFAGDSARFEAGADGVLRRESRRDSARPTG